MSALFSNYCYRLLAIVVLVAGHAITHALEESTNHCALRVGWEDWSPYIYRQNGSMAGPEYELLEQLAASADCTLVYVDLPWARALKLLKQQKIELLYASTKTPQREQFSQFSIPYRNELMRLVSRREVTGSQAEVSLTEWFGRAGRPERRRILGVVRGYHYGNSLQPILTFYERNNIIDVGSDNQLLEMLLTNRVDGYITEDLVAHEQVAESPAPLALLKIREATAEPMHLMFGLHVPKEIVQRFNRAIQQLPRD